MKNFLVLFSALCLSLVTTPLLAASSAPVSESFILAPAAGPALLKQCSRSTPKAEKFWQLSRHDVDDLERLLAPKLNGLSNASGKKIDKWRNYHRQYVGIVQDGRKFIYANFYPASQTFKDEDKTPVVVCDGGEKFWGIVYDPLNHTFAKPVFNGAV